MAGELALVTSQPSDDDMEQARSDAAFLRGVILDNEHWTQAGITEADLSVVFEMDARCGWGSDFTVRRLRRALAVLSEAGVGSGVVERAGRWFAVTNPTLETIDERGARVCARKGCGRDISHLRASSRYCSDRCGNLVRRRRGRNAA